MSWGQFREWMAYAKTEPFGERRDDLRSGVVASTIANANRDAQKHPEPFSPADFVLNFRDEDDGDGSASASASRGRRPLRDRSAWSGVKAMFKANAEAETIAARSAQKRRAARAAEVAERRRAVAERKQRERRGDTP